MKRIKLGKITAPVGIKGEVRVYPYLEQARFSDLESLCIEQGEAVRIEKIRQDKNMLVLNLSCCSDRNAAETLRNKELYLPDGEELDLGEDNYLIEDLIEMDVVAKDGALLGKLTDVISRSAQDLYEITKPDGGTFLLPAVKEFIVSIDLDERKMTVDLPEGLTDL